MSKLKPGLTMLAIHKDIGVELNVSSLDPSAISDSVKSLLSQFGQCRRCQAPLPTDISGCQRCLENGITSHEFVFDPEQWENISRLYRKQQRSKSANLSRAFTMTWVAGRHTDSDIRAIWDIQSGKCHFCGIALGSPDESRAFERDHLRPVAQGGTEWPSNIALTCTECNQLKGNRQEAAFWNSLKRRCGEGWVKEKKDTARGQGSKKSALTRRRRAETAKWAEEFEARLREDFRKLSEARMLTGHEPDAVNVRLNDDGITIEYADMAIRFPPSAHRRLGTWLKEDTVGLVEAIVKIGIQMGAIKEPKKPA